ncbi:MAG: uroporphyrinogen decarboxylase family protein [Candidatus Hodarchaeales archaeon]|jgi:uroporphyrinogen decarboxylase
MIPRERISAAVDRKPIDRFPIDMGGLVSSIARIAYDKFLKVYYPSSLPTETCNIVQQLACLDEKLLRKWGVDTRHVRPFFKSKSESKDSFIDAFGIKYLRVSSPKYDPLYYEMVDHPLKNSSNIKDIEDFSWPSFEPSQLEETRSLAKNFHKEGYAIIVDTPAGTVLEQAVYLCGMEKFLMNIHGNPEFTETLVERVTTFTCEYWEELLTELGEWPTIAMLGDDYGMQDRMLISPSVWRRLIKPNLKRVVKSIKKTADVKVMLHSCGSILPIIPDLIEVGVDMLNPIQPRAKDMDHGHLKAQFGDQICFHGGIDIQHVLPRGTPDEVQKEIERVTGSLGSNKTGYIFSPAHNIQADTPPQNIKAFFEAIETTRSCIKP